MIAEFRLGSEATGIEQSDPASRRIAESVDYLRDHFEEVPALAVACYDQRALNRAVRRPGTAVTILRRAGLRAAARLLVAMPAFCRGSEAASIYPAVENLRLAARAHGLGACLTTWHLLAEHEIKAILGIPKGVHTFAVIPLGWPLRPFGPVNREPVERVLHRDRW